MKHHDQHSIEEGMTREDIERMSDGELAQWMADDDKMADSQLLAGYREAAYRARGRHPDHDRMWSRIAERTVDKEEPSVPSAPRLTAVAVRIAVWIAAAAAVVLLLLMPAWRFMDRGTTDAKGRYSSADRRVPIVASVANPMSTDVIISSDGKAEKAADIAAHTIDDAITESEADFSKTDIGDVAATKTVVIPRGKVYKVTLPDGTEAWLNAESRLVFPTQFGGRKRLVELEGEAYFKVTKDSRRPFIVRTGNVSTKVLGTEFNIRSYGKASPEVALVEGSVEINDHNSCRSVRLNPGQAAVVGRDRIAVNHINTDYYRQWKKGFFYFDDAPLLEVMKELGRWYNISIEIEDMSLAGYNLHFIASRNESLGQIMSDLNFFSYLNVSKKGDKLTISRKKEEK